MTGIKTVRWKHTTEKKTSRDELQLWAIYPFQLLVSCYHLKAADCSSPKYSKVDSKYSSWCNWAVQTLLFGSETEKQIFFFFFSFLQTLFEINTNKNPPNRKPSKNQGERLAVPHDHKWVILPSIHLGSQYCCILCQFLSCSDERFCWNCPIKKSGNLVSIISIKRINFQEPAHFTLTFIIKKYWLKCKQYGF